MNDGVTDFDWSSVDKPEDVLAELLLTRGCKGPLYRLPDVVAVLPEAAAQIGMPGQQLLLARGLIWAVGSPWHGLDHVGLKTCVLAHVLLPGHLAVSLKALARHLDRADVAPLPEPEKPESATSSPPPPSATHPLPGEKTRLPGQPGARATPSSEPSEPPAPPQPRRMATARPIGAYRKELCGSKLVRPSARPSLLGRLGRMNPTLARVHTRE